MLNKESIRDFVRNVLGCLCPEEVFTNINLQDDVILDKDVVLASKIDIGGRLLIYVIKSSEIESIETVLPMLVFKGIAERDSKGFNRLRLVLVADDLEKTKQLANDVFSTLEKDEKTHLHIVHESEFPAE